MKVGFVGREADLERCLAATRGDLPGALMVGEARVGKSRLLREIASRLARDGRRVMKIVATAERPSNGRDSAMLRDLHRTITGPRTASTVLLVDDIHLLDPLTSTTIQQVHRAFGTSVIATTVPERAVADAAMDLWKDRGLEHITLGPLDPASTARLAAKLAGRVLSAGEVEEVWRLTAGNAGDLGDLILGARDLPADGVGRSGPLGAIDDNPRVRRAVTARLYGLSSTALRLYRALALAGEIPAHIFTAFASVKAIAELEDRAAIVFVDGDSEVVRPARRLDAALVAAALAGRDRAAAFAALVAMHEGVPVADRGLLIRRARWQREAGGFTRDLIAPAAWAALLTEGPDAAHELAVAVPEPVERENLRSEIGWLMDGRPRALSGSGDRLEAIRSQLVEGIFGADPEQAIALGEEHQRLVRRAVAAPAVRVALALCAQSWAWLACGRAAEHLRDLDAHREEYRGIAVQLDAARATLRGELGDDVADALAACGAALETSDPISQLPWVLAALAQAQARTGRSAEAVTTGRRLATIVPRWAPLDVEMARIEAVLALHAGRRAEGGRRLSAALAAVRPLKMPALTSRVAEDLLRFGWFADAGRILGETAAALRRPSPHLRALLTFATAAEGGDVGGLRRASTDLLAGGWRLAAAEAAARCSAAADARGDRLAAHALAVRAAVILPTPVRTPALDAGRPIISARKAEIARYAASGAPSPQIAAALNLSTRTVENHLQTAYGKLGIGSRETLRDVYADTMRDVAWRLTPARPRAGGAA